MKREKLLIERGHKEADCVKMSRADLFIQPEVRSSPLRGSMKASNQLGRDVVDRNESGSLHGNCIGRNRNSNSISISRLLTVMSYERQTGAKMNTKLLLMSKFITNFSSATSCLKLIKLPQLILLILLSLSSVIIPMTSSAIAQSNSSTNSLLPQSSSSSQTLPNLSPLFNQQSYYNNRQSNLLHHHHHHHHQEPEILILKTAATTSGNGELRKFSNFSEQQEELFSLKKRQSLLRELYQDQPSDTIMLSANDSQSRVKRQKRSLSSEQANHCHRLQKLWNSLTNSYPALAANLVAWAHNDIRLSAPLTHLLVEAEHASRDLGDLKPPKGWLSRVLANPVYSKLVRHLQSQRQLKQPANSLANAQSDAPDSEQAYGRVAHFPHELTQSSDTLNKLRQLSQQRRTLFGRENEELESNRIPTPESNSDPIVPDLDSDAARSSFVYGSVLLRPNQSNDNESQNERHMQNSLDNLRQLADTTKDRSVSGEEQQRLVQDSAESYGRVLTSPPNKSDTPQQTNGNVNQHITKQNDLTKGQSDSLRSRWQANKSTLDKLRHQLHPNQLDFGSGLGSGSGSESGANVDEFSTQQQAQLANVGAIQQQQQTDEPNVNEFEGIWHSGPLQQIEVRQERANEGQVNEEHQRIKHRVTTSNPNNVFLID